MKIKNLLFAIALTMMVLCAGISSTTASPAPRTCFSVCLSVFNACKASCNGDVQCIAECQDDYNSCRCGCVGQACYGVTK
jgi:hypothetical protein